MESINENSARQPSQVSEDLPQMRSVTLQPPSRPSSLPSLRSPAPGLGFPPPLKQFRPLSSKAPPVSSLTPAPVEPWKVGQLKPLPDMYFLERTNVYVSGVEPRQVAQRIAASLHKQSIVVKYNSNEASAKAETADGIRFKIRLFSDCGKVVTEVQRRSGCGYCFHKTSKAILLAAKGTTNTGSKRGPPKTFSVLASCRRRMQMTEEMEEKTIMETLVLVLSMLSQSQYETHQLAMQTLLSLSRKTTFAARQILCGKLMNVLACLIEHKQLKSMVTSIVDDIDEQHFISMRRCALTVVANCLDTLGKVNELHSVIKEDDAASCVTLMQNLLILEKHELSPHDSCQAERCLRSLQGIKTD